MYKTTRREKFPEQGALKLIENTKYLQNELNLLNIPEHQNLINIFGEYHDKINSSRGILMEYCNHETLFEFIKKYATPLNHIKIIMLCMFHAVAHLHNHKLAHCDIKLENIMVNANDNGSVVFKLGDYGFSRNIDADFSPNQAAGTETYCADNSRVLTPKIRDLWALGILLFVLYNHRFPWAKSNLSEKNYNKYVTQFLDADLVSRDVREPKIQTVLNPKKAHVYGIEYMYKVLLQNKYTEIGSLVSFLLKNTDQNLNACDDLLCYEDTPFRGLWRGEHLVSALSG